MRVRSPVAPCLKAGFALAKSAHLLLERGKPLTLCSGELGGEPLESLSSLPADLGASPTVSAHSGSCVTQRSNSLRRLIDRRA